MSRTVDPRWYQIGFLASLLTWVLWRGTFTLSPLAMLAAVGAALATQALFARGLSRPHGGYLSPLISSLSLCLLLRTESAAVAALAAVIAIASKFVLRVRGKHFFNPTNLGLLAVVLTTGQAWVSPGQWGSGAIAAFGVAALGLLVLRKIGRLDITLAFLASMLALQLGRMKDAGTMTHEAVSLAKRNNVWVARECAKLAREIHGANGIVNEYPIMRHLMNIETVYTYEGTHDIHTLVLGRYLTDIAAFEPPAE